MTTTTKTSRKQAATAAADRARMLSLRATRAHMTRATVALQAAKDRAGRAMLRERIAAFEARIAATA